MIDIDTINKCVINLAYRTDRMEAFRAQSNAVFHDELLYRIEGVEHTSPRIGIAQAHLSCIELAKRQEWPYVLIMEDDCKFQKGTRDHLTKLLSNLPPDWDILLGGIYEGDPVTFNEYWSSIGEFCGLHFYIVNQKCYDTLLAYDKSMHFDRFINHAGALKCYVAAKMFASQSDGYSDNVKAKVKYEHKLKKYKLL